MCPTLAADTCLIRPQAESWRECVGTARDDRAYGISQRGGRRIASGGIRRRGRIVDLAIEVCPRRVLSFRGYKSEGMATGASHFLIHTVCEDLNRSGVEIFNLGGAEEGSSLARFKAGFGASVVPLASLRCYVGPVWKRKLRAAVGLARGDRKRFLRALTGAVQRYFVYGVDTSRIHPTISMPDTGFRALSDEELRSIGDPAFREVQLERLAILGRSYAFGVYLEGTLSHVSWLVPSAVVNREPLRILDLTSEEAEITGCETLPQFRGRGLYPFAIQQICAQAQANGIRRIYMKTTAQNKASQSGIQKAGLARTATVVVVILPGLPGKSWVLKYREPAAAL